jgi:hypothetical protein
MLVFVCMCYQLSPFQIYFISWVYTSYPFNIHMSYRDTSTSASYLLLCFFILIIHIYCMPVWLQCAHMFKLEDQPSGYSVPRLLRWRRGLGSNGVKQNHFPKVFHQTEACIYWLEEQRHLIGN